MGNILFALWFFLPAGLANATPVFASKIKRLDALNIPIDGGRTFRGKRIFGEHKTVRGLVCGVVVGFIVVVIQSFLYKQFLWIQTISDDINYTHTTIYLMGPAMAFGALAGDAIKSFFKRQVGVKPGKPWLFFDQIDYIIGGLVAAAFFVDLSWQQQVVIAVVWFLLHPLANVIGWLFKIRESPI